MAIVILLLIFCGAMLLLDLMLGGFVKKMSNSKKRRDEGNHAVPAALRPGCAVLRILFQMCGLVRKDLTPYVYKSPYLEHPRIRLSDVRARQTRKILNR